jgi:type I restriction enzyme M protein
VERKETIRKIDESSGDEVLERVVVKERLVDDDLPEIALAYRRWLADQT